MSLLLQRITNFANKFGMYYIIKYYNEEQVYEFLCNYFLGKKDFDVKKYTLEQCIEIIDECLGNYSVLLSEDDKTEIYEIAKQIKEKI